MSNDFKDDMSMVYRQCISFLDSIMFQLILKKSACQKLICDCSFFLDISRFQNTYVPITHCDSQGFRERSNFSLKYLNFISRPHYLILRSQTQASAESAQLRVTRVLILSRNFDDQLSFTVFVCVYVEIQQVRRPV